MRRQTRFGHWRHHQSRDLDLPEAAGFVTPPGCWRSRDSRPLRAMAACRSLSSRWGDAAARHEVDRDGVSNGSESSFRRSRHGRRNDVGSNRRAGHAGTPSAKQTFPMASDHRRHRAECAGDVARKRSRARARRAARVKARGCRDLSSRPWGPQRATTLRGTFADVAMSLRLGQRRALRGIARDLADSDPRLDELFFSFTQLAGGGKMPRAEKIRTRPLRVITRPGRSARRQVIPSARPPGDDDGCCTS